MIGFNTNSETGLHHLCLIVKFAMTGYTAAHVTYDLQTLVLTVESTKDNMNPQACLHSTVLSQLSIPQDMYATANPSLNTARIQVEAWKIHSNI